MNNLISYKVDVGLIKKGISKENLIAFFKNLNNKSITVGIHADKGQKVLQKAYYNEFGTNHIAKRNYDFIKNGKQYIIQKGDNLSIPARPFVRLHLYKDIKDTINLEFSTQIDVEKHKQLRSPKESSKRIFRGVGEESVVLMRNKIANGGFNKSQNRTGKDQENNSSMTVEIKGFNHPLIETGELISSISYEVKGDNK